jgi:hypothetical protein
MSENLIVLTMAEMLAEGNNQKFCFGSVQEVLMIGQKKIQNICTTKPY